MKILIAVAKDISARNDVQDALRCRTSLEDVFLKKGLSVETLYLEEDNFEKVEMIKEKILGHSPVCVFNLFEGFGNNSQKEAEFVEILESTNIPYTGNSSHTLSLCLNKEVLKKILLKNSILVPKGFFIKDIKELKPDVLDFPLFIKPCFEDASVGIDRDSLVTEKQNAYEILEKKLKKFPQGVIVEEFISGKEYNVGFLGDYPYELLGISVIDYAKHKKILPFLSYNSKWETYSQEFKILLPSLEEPIDESFKKRIITLAKKVGEVSGCRNYFRVDLRETDGRLFVLDVNPNPDINQDSGFMKQAYYKGYTYEDIIEKILKSATIYLH